MGKHEPGTPKFIANKLKTKGLQKLQWYCQMCQKQCRDDNGFKCHAMSESHQKNLLMFADNSKKLTDEFSKDFLEGFMDLLRRQFGTKRVAANKVYQDYITNREHTHMNSTRWVTLTEFVQWLGRTEIAVVDETEKGWFVQYIDRDPEALTRQEWKNKKQKIDKDDEEKLSEFVKKQVQAGSQVLSINDECKAPTELIRKNSQKLISFQLNPQHMTNARVFKKPLPLPKRNENKKMLSDGDLKLLKELEATSLFVNRRKESWLAQGIVVKIETPHLGSKYYKQKAVIEHVEKEYQATVRTIETNHKIKLHQDDIKTVVPRPGNPVLILQGEHKFKTAVLTQINWDSFEAELEVKSHDSKEGVTVHLHYDDFSKIWKKN